MVPHKSAVFCISKTLAHFDFLKEIPCFTADSYFKWIEPLPTSLACCVFDTDLRTYRLVRRMGGLLCPAHIDRILVPPVARRSSRHRHLRSLRRRQEGSGRGWRGNSGTIPWQRERPSQPLRLHRSPWRATLASCHRRRRSRRRKTRKRLVQCVRL